MKYYLVMVLLCISKLVSAATYYVAPNGSDSNPGTITQPFFTLNKAWSVITAGDIIYMRGGSYHYGTTMNVLSAKSGTSSNPIKVMAYPGEYPVIDYAGVNLTGQKIGLRLNSINYVYFKGIRICNMAQENTGNAWPNYGIILYDDVSNCTFEQMEVDHIGGTGFTIANRCNNNLFLNCDSHHHADPYSAEPYGMSDGFESGSHGSNTSTNNTFKNCRSWSNSDDGWDLRQADGVYILDNCWSFRNGFIPGTTTIGGNGDGYKLGGKTGPGTSTILRTIKNSMAFENRSTGITPEPDASDNVFGLDIYNCTSYKNGRDLGEGINTGNYNNYTRIRNTIAYGNYRTNAWMQGGAVHDHNSWDIPVTVNDADFLSVNSSGVEGTRQPDGNLPVTNFLHLASGSDLIDAGTNAGLSYAGSAPDLGAFEFQTVFPPASPLYISSSVANSTPSMLEMTYNLSLANIVPAVSSYIVMVNAASRSVSSVVVSGSKVQLSLSSPVVYGDVVTVAYTKPSSNPLQTTAGGQAVTISAQTVTNNVSAVLPVYVSSVIQNAAPTLLEMTYNLTLANIIPATSSFTVMVNSVSRTFSSVAISGTKVQLTLSTPVVYGDVVTVAYTKPSSNPIQTTSGGQAITTGAQTVTNNVNAVLPVYVSSAIQNATATLLEMTYNLNLANIIPAASSFSVLVNSAARGVSTVVVSGTKVQLTLSSPVVNGDVVTVAYTKPSSNPIQTTSGGQAISIGAQSVTNNVNAVVTGFYYVSPNGSDTNPGTITQPFLTLNKAWSVVAAGSTIYMRGGSYHYGTTMNILANKSGTSANIIKIWAYPGEYPVIDYEGVNLTGQKIGLRLSNANYIYLKGIRICNMAQEHISNAWTHYGIILYDDVNNCTFEQIEVDHIGGTGFTIADRSSNNIFLNCDSHHNQDPYSSKPYDMADGFESGSHGTNTSTNNIFRNCRAWSNSDDGWDLGQADGIYVIDNCWSFRNGFIPGTTTAGGNGDGYKLGGKTSPATNSILRTIKKSLAFENRATGITPEPDASTQIFGLDIVNCTSYKNARDLGEGINTGNYNNYTRVRNCISYANIHSNVWMQGGSVHDHNNWDIPRTVSDADFVSVNSSGVDGARQADGSLPVTSFLRLAPGSDLIDVGVNAGMAYNGIAPDLGAFESAGFASRKLDVTIANPQMGSTYDELSSITIDAIVTDNDRTVNKVEFYNGQIRIAELPDAPYSYNWKDVSAGTYSITVLAIDNLNDTTFSDPVKIEIKAKVAETRTNGENAQIVDLYPNPNNGHFSIIINNPLYKDESEITITDLSGRKVYSALISKDESIKEFNIPGIRSGMYLMMIKDNQKILTKKFIVK